MQATARKIIIGLVLAMMGSLSPLALALPKGVDKVGSQGDVTEYRLRSNGLKVLVVSRPYTPVATLMVLYKVGSRNEAVGHTGSTHLLEHMMFKGTNRHNAQKGNQVAKVLRSVGASYNATTWLDRTNYFATLPSTELALAASIEADRMRGALLSDKDRQSEGTVVLNELERGENNPENVLDIQLYATAFREHPYHHPTIGWRSDVANMPTSRLREFYDTYYHPNNATVIIVGGVSPDEALKVVVDSFGKIKPSPQPIPVMYTEEPPQQGERRFVLRRQGELPLVMMGYHIPGGDHPDTYPLAVLDAAMSGAYGSRVSSRLYQALVETRLAVRAHSNPDRFRDPGLFTIFAALRPGVDPAEVEAAIDKALVRLKEEPITAQELQKAKNQIEASFTYQQEGTTGLAFALGEAESTADWKWHTSFVEKIRAVTAAQVQDVAKRTFRDEARTVGIFLPTKATGGPSASQAPAAGASPLADALPQGFRARWYQDPALSDVPHGPLGLMAPSTAAAQTKLAEKIKVHRLDSGATLWVLETPGSGTVSVQGSFLAGSYLDPPGKAGLADLTAAMLDQGTQKHSKLELATELEFVGASVDVGSGTATVGLEAKTLPKDFDLATGILAEVLRYPTFPQEELDKTKERMVAGIRESQDDTSVVGTEALYRALYPKDHPYYDLPAEERIAMLQGLTRADLEAFHKEHYGPETMKIVVVGDLQADKVKARFDELFRGFQAAKVIRPSEPNIPETKAGRQSIAMQDKSNVDVFWGMVGDLRRADKDYLAAVMANSALGGSTLTSRLGLVLRDKEGLTYGVRSYFDAPTIYNGPWTVSITVNPKNVDQALEGIDRIVKGYLKEGIDPKELELEKRYYTGVQLVQLQTNAGLSQALHNALFYELGVDYLDRLPDLIRALTKEEVDAAIRKRVHPEKAFTVIVGPVKN